MSLPRKLAHIARLPMRWGDMDAYGHVNNTVYFRYMEQARIDWIEQFGIKVGPENGHGPVIINASCTFLMPLTYPGEVEIRTFIGALGRSSIETFCEFRVVGDERLYAEGASKVVWMDVATGKSVALPEHVRRALEALPG